MSGSLGGWPMEAGPGPVVSVLVPACSGPAKTCNRFFASPPCVGADVTADPGPTLSPANGERSSRRTVPPRTRFASRPSFRHYSRVSDSRRFASSGPRRPRCGSPAAPEEHRSEQRLTSILRRFPPPEKTAATLPGTGMNLKFSPYIGSPGTTFSVGHSLGCFGHCQTSPLPRRTRRYLVRPSALQTGAFLKDGRSSMFRR